MLVWTEKISKKKHKSKKKMQHSVFGVAELFEMVIGFLKVDELCRLRSVCKYFDETICGAIESFETGYFQRNISRFNQLLRGEKYQYYKKCRRLKYIEKQKNQ